MMMMMMMMMMMNFTAKFEGGPIVRGAPTKMGKYFTKAYMSHCSKKYNK